MAENKTTIDWNIINRRKQINEDITSSVFLLSDEERNLPEKEKEKAIRKHFKFLQDWRKEELKPWERRSLADDRAMEEGQAERDKENIKRSFNNNAL